MSEKKTNIEVEHDFLSSQQAAAYLHVSTARLWQLRRAGLPHYRLGERVLFKREELRSYIEQNCRVAAVAAALDKKEK